MNISGSDSEVEEVQVPGHISRQEDDDEIDAVMNMPVKKTRGQGKKYRRPRRFPSEEAALEHVAPDWKYLYKRPGALGSTAFYKCKLASKFNCPALCSLFYHPSDEHVTVKTCGEHDHTSENQRGLSDDVKTEIARLYRNGVTTATRIAESIYEEMEIDLDIKK
jgi:hypothetical protein